MFVLKTSLSARLSNRFLFVDLLLFSSFKNIESKYFHRSNQTKPVFSSFRLFVVGNSFFTPKVYLVAALCVFFSLFFCFLTHSMLWPLVSVLLFWLHQSKKCWEKCRKIPLRDVMKLVSVIFAAETENYFHCGSWWPIFKILPRILFPVCVDWLIENVWTFSFTREYLAWIGRQKQINKDSLSSRSSGFSLLFPENEFFEILPSLRCSITCAISVELELIFVNWLQTIALTHWDKCWWWWWWWKDFDLSKLNQKTRTNGKATLL